MFQAEVAGQVFTISELPLLGFGLTAMLAWIAPLVAWILAIRSEEPRGCLPGLGAGVLGMVAALFLGVGGALAVILVSLPADDCVSEPLCVPALHVFDGLELALFGGLSMLALVWGLTFAAIGFNRFHPAAALGALAWVALCSLGAAPVVFQLGSLARIGPLPRVTLDGPPFLHEQRTASFEVKIHHPHPERIELPTRVDVPPSPAGTFRQSLNGRAGPLTFTTLIEVPIEEERGHPHFPLRVGNQWVYAPFFATGASARVFFSGGRRSKSVDHSRTVKLTVEEPVVERGVRWFQVRIVTPEEEEVVKVAAVDGEVRTEDGRTFVGGETDPTASFQSSSSCTLRPLQSFGSCSCPDRIGGIVDTPPGPSKCSTKSGGGFLEGLVRGVTMVASIGMIDPGSSKKVRGIELVHFERGPDAAPAAEPDWTFTPIPKVVAAREALAEVHFERDKVAALKRAVAGANDLSCDAAEVILLGEPFFYQDDLLVALAPHMAEPLACTDLIAQVARMDADAAELVDRVRAATQ